MDADAAVLANATATGDDTNGTDDEDGVTIPATLTLGVASTVAVNLQTAAGYLNAWFDWNQDGDFLDAGEQVTTDQAVAVGTTNLSITPPTTSITGTSFARFRVCTSTALCNTPASAAASGEVEDYSVMLKPRDFGDAPASYGSPYHTIFATLQLGAIAPDGELSAQPTATANGDDSNGSDDEDAIVSFPTLTEGDTSYSLSNIPVTNTTGGAATLYGWIDVNYNNRFDGNEAATVSVANNATTATLSWTGLSGVTTGTTYLRLRLTTQALTNTNSATLTNLDTRSDGAATDGEVEDYTLTISPIPAGPGPGGVINAALWVKSDDAGTISTAWKDHAASNNPVEAVGSWSLSPANAAHNFHPYTSGYSTSKYFQDPASSVAPANVYTQSSLSVFSAVRPTSITAGRITGTDNENNTLAEPSLSLTSTGNPRFYKYWGTTNALNHTGSMTANYSGLPYFVVNDTSKAVIVGLDSTTSTTTMAGNTFGTWGPYLNIGYGTWDVNGAFPGDIMEVIWYKKALSQNEQDRVNSYLAVKNGVTLSIHYLNSDSTPTWNRSTNSGFNNNIAGIGRDDQATLNQKQSNSINAGNQVILGNGSSLLASNAANTNTIGANNSLLLWGDNAGAESFATAVSVVSNSTYRRMSRVWKVQKTGSAISTISAAYPYAGNNLFLIIGNTADFSGTNVAYPMTTQTIGGVNYRVANAVANAFASAQYFTFGIGYDYGDAPASYGAPSHDLTGSAYLGVNPPDSELAATAPLDGSGDDVTDSDDEDGITLPTLTQGQTTSITATVTGAGGYLQGWIDFNGDGDFNDAGEQVATNIQDNLIGDTNAAAGAITFAVSVPANAVTTQTYARFRWATTLGLNATAAANDGEVEDYALTVAVGENDLSGKIFEDTNYGGGAGRPFAGTAGTAGILGVRVELYNAAGAFVTSTTSVSGGGYSFTNMPDGNYYVRVVNDTIRSSRLGSDATERSVQTYRSDGTTTVTSEIGGRNPAVVDSPSNTTNQTLNTTSFVLSGGGQAQSVMPITLAGTSLTSIYFGFNFDTIINTNDSGQGSLRQFISNSNLLGNTGLDQATNSNFDPQAGQETSIFMIPSSDANMASGVATITVNANMPSITAADTHFNGYTQAGALPGAIGSRTLKVRILTNGAFDSFKLAGTANNTVVAGFNFDAFTNTAPVSSLLGASNLHVKGNYMGTLINGTAGSGVAGGIEANNSPNVKIGVVLDGGAATSNDGMSDAEEGNLIGKTFTAISIWNQNGHIIAGNWIGVDSTGLSALPNSQYGIYMPSVADTQVGGTSLLQRNIIAASQLGLSITGLGSTTERSTNVTVLGNYIGVGKDGVTAIPNTNTGIAIIDADQVQIGDGSAAGANVVSGNTNYGIVINGYHPTNSPTTNVVIKSNLIGVAANGSTARGNGRAGIAIAGESSNNEISDNIIANNTGDGVEIAPTMAIYSGIGTPTNNTVLHNSLFKNGGLGIDLSANDVTLNDSNDSDAGSNNLLNFPLFKTAQIAAGNLTISGCAPAGSKIELFEADVSPTSSSGVTVGANQFGKTQDYGEGERYIQTFTEGTGEDSASSTIDCAALTDADGNSAVGMSPFQWTMALPANVVIGDKFTATSTMTGIGTSEFSPVALISVTTDYGDAPASYGAPVHNILTGLYLGSAEPDAESSSQASATATGDDTTGSDDEDGVILPTEFTPNQIIPITVTATGAGGKLQAWIDWNGDGDFADTGEQIAKNVVDNAGVDTDATAGVIIFNVTPPATAVAGSSYARFRWSTQSNLNATAAANDGEVEDYVVTIAANGTTLSIAGRVFNDTNVDGIDNTEAGIKAVVMVLHDTTAGTCQSTKTAADGSYQFADLGAGDYQVYEAVGAKIPTPATCPPTAKDPNGYVSSTTNHLAITLSTTAVNNANFGDVRAPTFSLDNSKAILPHSTVTYPHVFQAYADGNVLFNLDSEQADPTNLTWGATLFLDANCDAKLGQGDTPITAPLAVNAGDKLCILTKVAAPADAPTGALHVLTVSSDFQYGDASLIPASHVQTHTDRTQTSAGSNPEDPTKPSNGEGKLSLEKSVWNVSRNIAGSVALPSETLRYTIHYENIGNGLLNELAIQDSVPEFTQLLPASVTCGITPPELAACSPQVNGNRLEWLFTGKLKAGSTGEVSYEVTVE